jgi:hypothetical protein
MQSLSTLTTFKGNSVLETEARRGDVGGTPGTEEAGADKVDGVDDDTNWKPPIVTESHVSNWMDC